MFPSAGSSSAVLALGMRMMGWFLEEAIKPSQSCVGGFHLFGMALMRMRLFSASPLLEMPSTLPFPRRLRNMWEIQRL